MPATLSRSDFCRISLSGALGLACNRGSVTTPEPRPDASVATPPAPVSTPKTDQVSKRQLGSTGMEVSMLGLGGAHIGKPQLTEAEATWLMHAAADGGITFFDNCWDYNEGRSEELMGKALRQGYRGKVFLMTKLDGRTARSATAQLEQSLKRLQTDVIDLVQIHEVIRKNDPERSFAPDGTIGALQAAKKAGKLRFIGFTGHKDPAIHLHMLDVAQRAGFEFDAVQMPLNVMDAHYKSFEHGVLPVLLQRKVGVLGMKSMGSGDILKSGAVTAEECLRYALSLPTSVVITGIDSREVLEQDLKLARSFVPLTGPERQALLARTKAASQRGEHELFKTADKYDGTAKNPHWLEGAKL